MRASSPSLAEIEAQIQRLSGEREALERQRGQLRTEELKILADAYARKLQAAGFTVRQGMAALKPYADLAAARPQATAAPASPAPRQEATQAPPAREDLRARARRVLGEDGLGWLRRAHPLLGGQSPAQVAATPQGEERVRALLAAYARGA